MSTDMREMAVQKFNEFTSALWELPFVETSKEAEFRKVLGLIESDKMYEARGYLAAFSQPAYGEVLSILDELIVAEATQQSGYTLPDLAFRALYVD